MTKTTGILRRLEKAVALYEKHNPAATKSFYDLPAETRRDYYHRANTRSRPWRWTT